MSGPNDEAISGHRLYEPRVVPTASLGLRADAPRDRLVIQPLRPSPFGDLSVRGLRVRGEAVEVDLTDDGDVHEVRAPAWLDVEVR